MVTAAGSGYSRWRDIAVTRWREDPTCDPWGFFLLLRDVAGGEVWSAGYQPVGCEPDTYEAAFFEDRAEIIRADGSMLTATEILVSPEVDAEVRRVSITNRGGRAREIEVTSYAEVVLASAGVRLRAPGILQNVRANRVCREMARPCLATRRSREPGDPPLWMFHHSRRGRRMRPALCNSRPTGRDSLEGGVNFAMPRVSWVQSLCRTPPAPCSIRCSRCAAGCASPPANPLASPFGAESPRAAPRRSR